MKEFGRVARDWLPGAPVTVARIYSRLSDRDVMVEWSDGRALRIAGYSFVLATSGDVWPWC